MDAIALTTTGQIQQQNIEQLRKLSIRHQKTIERIKAEVGQDYEPDEETSLMQELAEE